MNNLMAKEYISKVTTVSQNKVLKNTYLLLSATLLFSCGISLLTMIFNLPHPGIIVSLVGYFGLLFGVYRFKDHALGIAFVFLLTGFMGYTLGPIVNTYLSYANGAKSVAFALGSTAVVFLGLSGYALMSRKDFSFLRGMLISGIIVGFVASLAAILFNFPALSLAVSVMFVFLMSGLILYETSNIVRGGETNYVLATVTLFVVIFNLFVSLLQLLGFMNSSE